MSYDPEKIILSPPRGADPRLRTSALNDSAVLLPAGLQQTHKRIKAGNDSALSLVTQPAKVTADRSPE